MKTVNTIFGNKSNANSITAPVFEGYNVEDNGDLIALQESYEDQLNIVRSIHALDSEILTYQSDVSALKEASSSDYEFEQRNKEFEVVTEASVRGAWDSIKAFFNKIWGKIKAFFASVVRYFDGLFRSAQGFAKKYEAQLKRLVLDGFEFKMYTYTNLDMVGEIPTAEDDSAVKALYKAVFETATTHMTADQLKALRTQIDISKEKKEEVLNGFRGHIVGKGSLNAEEYKAALFSFFRGGAKDDSDKKEQHIDINKILEEIKNTDAKKKIEAFAKETDKEFSDVLKRVDTLANKFRDAKPSADGKEFTADVENHEGITGEHVISASARGTVIEGVRATATFITSQKDVSLQSFRTWREAWAERDRTYRSICIAAFHYKKKKD